MRAWIEPDPEYFESNSVLSIEVVEDTKATYAHYALHRRLPWHLEMPDNYPE